MAEFSSLQPFCLCKRATVRYVLLLQCLLVKRSVPRSVLYSCAVTTASMSQGSVQSMRLFAAISGDASLSVVNTSMLLDSKGGGVDALFENGSTLLMTAATGGDGRRCAGGGLAAGWRRASVYSYSYSNG